MTTTTLTSRAFNQDVGKAEKAAEVGPVIITDRGEPKHVLLSIEDYRRLAEPPRTIGQRLSMSGVEDVDLEPVLPARRDAAQGRLLCGWCEAWVLPTFSARTLPVSVAVSVAVSVEVGRRAAGRQLPSRGAVTDAADLQRLRVDAIVVGGHASQFCIDTTVRAAASGEIGATALADGHTTRDRPHVRAATTRAHLNWLGPEMSNPSNPIRVMPAAALEWRA